MGETGDRIDRAERYVLGLMDDVERERAERDLEIDPAFREALVVMAERMHVFDRTPAPEGATQDQWRLLKAHIEAMPQMRPAEPQRAPPSAGGPARGIPAKPAGFGRRRTDHLPASEPGTGRVGLHSVRGRAALAIVVVAAFAAGYLAGVSSVSAPQDAPAVDRQ